MNSKLWQIKWARVKKKHHRTQPRLEEVFHKLKQMWLLACLFNFSFIISHHSHKTPFCPSASSKFWYGFHRVMRPFFSFFFSLSLKLQLLNRSDNVFSPMFLRVIILSKGTGTMGFTRKIQHEGRLIERVVNLLCVRHWLAYDFPMMTRGNSETFDYFWQASSLGRRNTEATSLQNKRQTQATMKLLTNLRSLFQHK